MKKSIVLSILIWVCGSLAAAPGPALPTQSLGMPKVFNESLLKETNVNAFLKAGDFNKNNLTNKPWYVYSDRDNNVTYVAPSTTSAQCTTLKFNETLRVAKIQNGFALVYVDPVIQIGSLQISQEAVSKGWVPLTNLLLWSSSLANDKGIYYKALFCRNLDNKESATKEIPTTTCYFDPVKMTSKREVPSDMKFYFIMKRSGNRVLLATESKISTKAASDKLLVGWVGKDDFVSWNQRSCAEPTWIHNHVEYFADKNIEIEIFENKEMNTPRISSVPFRKKEYERRPKYIYRMAGNDLRFPILDDGNTQVYNLSTFKTAGENSKGESISEAEQMQLARYEKMQKINLAIVIDGTDSMKDYYPAVKEAIKEGCRYFNNDKYKIKVGVVIYRDYADGEKGLVETLPLTSVRNIDLINDFLDSGGSYGIQSSPKDKTKAEALYNGINTALDKLKFSNEESNMMLIVGDCGNDVNDNRIQREDLVKKLMKNNMHIMGFQVQNKAEEAYNNFNTQIMWLIRNTLSGIYKELLKDKPASADRIVIRSPGVKSDTGHNEGYNYVYPDIDFQLYTGSYRRAISEINGGKMAPEKLTLHMKQAISSFATTIQGQIDIIQTKANDITANIDDSNANMVIEQSFLERSLGADWREKWKKRQVVSFKGYTPRNSKEGYPYFQPIVFIAEAELRELLKRLEPVYRAAIVGDVRDRKPYFEAMKAMVRSFAPGLSEAEMGALTNAEISKMIVGLNEAPQSLTKYRLDDLTNDKVLPVDKYQSIINDFRNKYDNLYRQVLQSTRYEYKRTFGDVEYYWLPIEMLP